MTFANQTNRVAAVGTGAAQTVAFAFPITANSDITVLQRVTATGVESDLDETTHYTVVNNGVAGGSITTVAPFVAATAEIHIIRDTPMTQNLDLTAGGDFSSTDVESALDKITKLIIENDDRMSRLLQLPITDPESLNSEIPDVTTRKGNYLFFDATTGAVTVAESVDMGDAILTVYTKTLLDDNDKEAAQQTLGLLDEDAMGSDSNELPASQQSIKAFVTTGTITMTNKTLTSPVLNTGLSGTAFLDEDAMGSNSATKAASQQSIKAFVTVGVVTMTNKTLTTPALTTPTMTNPVINTGVTGTAVLDEDNMASDSNTKLATQQSIKKYVDDVASPDYIRLHDSKATTTHGGTFTAGAWQKRTVTEDVDTGANAAVAASVIVLAAGTYECHITCPGKECNAHQARLRNTTAGATILVGTCERVLATEGVQTRSLICGRFTIAGAQNLEIQHRCGTTRLNDGFGIATSFGENEIYTVAEFWKRA